MTRVGWRHVQWRRPVLQLLPGMQIDLGGIGKEYAVDLTAARIEDVAPELSCLINFGGDIVVRNPRRMGSRDESGSRRRSAQERQYRSYT